MYFKIIFATCFLVHCVVGQIPFSCPNTQTVNNLNLERFQGTWFEIEIANTDDDTLSSSCGRFDTDFQTIEGMNALAINNSRRVNDELLYAIGGGLVNPQNTGAIIVNLMQGTASILQEVSVMVTDYNNYALLLMCDQTGGTTHAMSLKLSRSRNGLSSGAINAINAAVTANTHISGLTWREMDQSEDTCGSSAVVAVASTLLLALFSFINLVGRM